MGISDDQHVPGVRQGSFDGVAVPRYAGDVLWDAKGIHVHGLEAALLGGSGKFEIDVPPAPGQARVDAQRRVYRIRAEPLMDVDAWLEPFRRFWSTHVDALERHLDRMEQVPPKKRKKR